MLLKHIPHPQADWEELVTLNGQIAPTIAIRPGETQFWRIGNVGADLFLTLVRADGSRVSVLLSGAEAVAVAGDLIAAARLRMGRAGWPSARLGSPALSSSTSEEPASHQEEELSYATRTRSSPSASTRANRSGTNAQREQEERTGRSQPRPSSAAPGTVRGRRRKRPARGETGSGSAIDDIGGGL